MNKSFPVFECAFLNGIAKAFSKRSRAITYSGTLTWDTDIGDIYEWITFTYKFSDYPVIHLQPVEDQRLHLYIRSNKSRDRGKVLLAIEDLFVFATPELIVSTFENTIVHSSSVMDEHERADECRKLKMAWEKLPCELRDRTFTVLSVTLWFVHSL